MVEELVTLRDVHGNLINPPLTDEEVVWDADNPDITA
jgi:hypothetical protein